MVYFHKTYRDGEINLPFTDVGKLCSSPEFRTRRSCVLTLFAKIRSSRKFLNTVQNFPFFESVNVPKSAAERNKRRHRGSYMSALVLLNLLNELRKNDRLFSQRVY